MEQEELSCWAESFAEFCGRFEDLFAWSETRQQAQKYVRGLLAPLERKTSWQLAEQLADSSPDRMQRLLSRAPMSMQMRHEIGSNNSSSSVLGKRWVLLCSMRRAFPRRTPMSSPKSPSRRKQREEK